ncbi:hypothetical protein [Methanocella conradii]|uniref:hypothetical protein n=1 Tax=Methanocella conradii TaxID=1175444 RepID=UPI00157D5CA0|nr:hypothetical protein [Methanocella conradii]
MEITQMLAFAAIAVELIVIFISLYLYNSYKLRIFYFLAWGAVTLLMASAIQAFIAVDTSVYLSVLSIAAGLFFTTGALTAV